ncbi:hypothetical protein CBR_g3002 [Chara braunii]|uniref:Uncharacterized protein n=1 Tax=Chara braunii TaxID=69332 RepID=A0A388KEH5_CHABU|nr:hypothetical protein CBR_g3002 [Chara braunii]|eukprot:GBG68458.1 hypothetical protein CBR_g3002 [Chara braunii]
MEIWRETGKKEVGKEGGIMKRDRKMKKSAKVNEYGKTIEEEKERLRREIALQEAVDEKEEEDDELLFLRRRAAGLSIQEKRKQRKEMSVGDSPPMTTPTKRTGLSTVTKLRIEELRCAEGKATSSSIPEPVGKIGLSLKHVTAGCGQGGKEKFEAECRDLYEALTIEELKEACKVEKVAYGKRDLAIKRLVTRRVVKAYDPVNIPLPPSPTSSGRVTRSAKEKGFEGIAVKKRGKGMMLCKGSEPEGYRRVDFQMLIDFVTSDLRNCYTKAGGYVLQQKIGIPMGKSSSPPLACLMCAKAEWDFLIALGGQRRLVAGLRFVDDASVFVAYN